jgi:hypothetical protein
LAASPNVRKTLRKGAAYSLAGILMAGDAAHRMVNAVAKGARSAIASREAPEARAANAPPDQVNGAGNA